MFNKQSGVLIIYYDTVNRKPAEKNVATIQLRFEYGEVATTLWHAHVPPVEVPFSLTLHGSNICNFNIAGC